MKDTIIFLLILILLGCSNTSKSSSNSDLSTLSITKTDVDSVEISKNTGDTSVMGASESRAVEKGELPISIDFEKVKRVKVLNFSQNYSQVKYIKLEHPLAKKGIGFLTNASYNITYESGAVRARGGTGIYSEVYLSPDKIIVGDPYFGYYYYDQTGKWLSTIVVMDDLPIHDVEKNSLSINAKSSQKMISHFNAIDKYCSFVLTKGNERELFFYDNATQKSYSSINFSSSRGEIQQLNKNIFVHVNYIPTNSNRKEFMHTFNINGDTLCRFLNYNEYPRLINKGRDIRILETTLLYSFDNNLTIRQAYNDTVFRMTAESHLSPVYVLNWGSKKIDIETALFGNASGKLILHTWNENKEFIYIVFTEDADTPINRKINKVKYNYAYFDKKEKQLYGVNYSGYPEDHIFVNNLKNGIPVYACRLRSYMDKLYTYYTKSQLKSMMELEGFSELPIEQQKKVALLSNEMGDNEMLLMIIL